MATNQFGAPCTANLGGVVDYYSKDEINNLLKAKPNTSIVYTRSVLDARFESLSELVASLSASQIDETRLLPYLEQTKEEILFHSEATYAKISSVYTQQEVDSLINGVDLDPSSVVRTSPELTATNTIYPGANNAVALTIRGSSVNPTVSQWLNASGSSLAKINADGSVYFERSLDLGRSMSDGSSALYLNGKRVSGIADPVSERDAVPLSFLKTYILDYYAEISRPNAETFYTINAGAYDSPATLRDSYRHVNSSSFGKRPVSADLLEGEIAINYNTISLGLFIKDSLGKVRKIGPAYVGSSPPNPSGYTLLSDGEMWIDKSGLIPILRYYDEASDSWIGTGVEISVINGGGDGSLEYDNETGNLTYTGPSAEEVRAHFTAGQGIVISDGEISISPDTEISAGSFTLLNGLTFKSGDFSSVLTTQPLTQNRSITLPNANGRLLSTGDTGTITSSMIANGTIVDEDISPNAQISDLKISVISSDNRVNISSIDIDGAQSIETPLEESDLLFADKGGSGNNYSFSLLDLHTYIFDKISGDVVISSNGTSSISSGSIVNSDISTSAGIAVNKLAKGTALQLLQVNSLGNTVSWVSDVTIPGTLDVNSTLSVRAQSALRLWDLDNSNFVGFRSPAVVNASIAWALPSQDGQNRQVLSTDGQGNLTFANSGIAAGNNTEIQYNSDGSFAASPDFTWDDSGKKLDISGDIILDSGTVFETVLQSVTPTQDRVISFPDATGTVALVSGSPGQLIYNSSGLYSGVAGSLVDTLGNISFSSRVTTTKSGSDYTPAVLLTGTWPVNGTATTTKPQLLIEPSGATSTGWSTSGTGLGVNASSTFSGNLIDLQVNGSSKLIVKSSGSVLLSSGSNTAPSVSFISDTDTGVYSSGSNQLSIATGGVEQLRFTSDRYLRLTSGTLGIQFNGDTAAANALDDYEEGTWTLNFYGSDGSVISYKEEYTDTPRYQVVGNTVTAYARGRWSANTTYDVSTNGVSINLPFTPASFSQNGFNTLGVLFCTSGSPGVLHVNGAVDVNGRYKLSTKATGETNNPTSISSASGIDFSMTIVYRIS